MGNGEAWKRAIFCAVLIAATAALTAGCNAKHTVGDTVIYDPNAEDNGSAEDREAEASEADQQAKRSNGGSEPKNANEAGARESDGTASGRSAETAPDETTDPEPQAGQFVKAKGTSVGDEDWVAEIRGEGQDLWLASPYDPAATYAMVRAATYLQGLRMAEEDFEERRFTTSLAYKAWHPEGEGGWALTVKIFSKGWGKDARYRFRVAVDPWQDGSRVKVTQYRQVMEEEPHQDVGDWVAADEPDPEITRKYLEGVQRAIGE